MFYHASKTFLVKNNTLPADVQNEIANKAAAYADQQHANDGDDIHIGYLAGATAYAIWKVRHDQLQHLSANETRLMLDDHAKLQQQYNQMKDRADKMEQLIEEFLETHENEALLDRNIFNKFQNLMDGAE